MPILCFFGVLYTSAFYAYNNYEFFLLLSCLKNHGTDVLKAHITVQDNLESVILTNLLCSDMLSIMALPLRTYATWQHQSMKSEGDLICGRLHLNISTFREPEHGLDWGPSRLLVPQHGTIFLQAFDHWNLLNGNWRPTCSDLHINMYCRPSYNVLSILFLIVRRPWPNFVCKGRHTSSVVLVLLVLQWRRASVGGWMHQMLQLIEFKLVVLVFRCLHGMALPYLECELRRVPDTDSLWRLRSMSITASTCSATDTSCYRW